MSENKENIVYFSLPMFKIKTFYSCDILFLINIRSHFCDKLYRFTFQLSVVVIPARYRVNAVFAISVSVREKSRNGGWFMYCIRMII
jgi:hypothetical protein